MTESTKRKKGQAICSSYESELLWKIADDFDIMEIDKIIKLLKLIKEYKERDC